MIGHRLAQMASRLVTQCQCQRGAQRGAQLKNAEYEDLMISQQTDQDDCSSTNEHVYQFRWMRRMIS